MNIKGTYVIELNREDLFDLLQEEEVLARIAPGVSKIERLGEDQYKAISDISIGPVRGSFEGALKLTDKKPPESMTLVLEQKSKMGHAAATIVMNLTSSDNQSTDIAYEGKAKVTGRLATMGQRILGGVISTLTKQVFKELEDVIEERHPRETKAEVPLTAPSQDIERSMSATQSGEPNQTKKKSFIQYIIDKIVSIWR